MIIIKSGCQNIANLIITSGDSSSKYILATYYRHSLGGPLVLGINCIFIFDDRLHLND